MAWPIRDKLLELFAMMAILNSLAVSSYLRFDNIFFFPPPSLFTETNFLKGTTNASHPRTPQPDNWIYCHSDNHWQQKETMREFAEKVLFRARLEAIEKLNLAEDQMAVRHSFHSFSSLNSLVFTDNCIFYFHIYISHSNFFSVHDVYCRHRDESFLTLLTSNNFKSVFVPANRTDDLQLHDVYYNKNFKQGVRTR